MAAAERRAPKLLVFDLDQCLWSFDAALPRYGPPHRASDGAVQCQAAAAKPFKEAAEIVRQVNELPDIGPLRVAIASRNAQEKICIALLQHMGLFQDSPGGPGIDRSLLAIYPGSKTTHFQQLAKASGVDFQDMIFFDDKGMNIRAAQSLGIVAQQVSPLRGVTWKDFHAAMGSWHAQRRSSQALTRWLTGKPEVAAVAVVDLVEEDIPVPATDSVVDVVAAASEGTAVMVVDLCE
ncbi:unnamed protein product [Effrenium voratum]|uniref:Magnesium-dependent phosphatase-1 n=1 Tax=Effrenium voratum TaxID=2562239 RepID=A0AA36JGN5_9DINO|nr:unnamed protein product [Effrenium voratum]CAJ1421518.1 unnamed protein product [Effrenium voratum]